MWEVICNIYIYILKFKTLNNKISFASKTSFFRFHRSDENIDEYSLNNSNKAYTKNEFYKKYNIKFKNNFELKTNNASNRNKI